MDNNSLLSQVNRKLDEAKKSNKHTIYLMTLRLDNANKTALASFCKENKLDLEIKTCGLGNTDVIITF